MGYFQTNKNNGNLLIFRYGIMEFGFSLKWDVRLAIIGSSGLGFDNIKHIILT